MAKVATQADNEVHITYEDQQQINKFARHNAKLTELNQEMEEKKKELQNLEDAADELVILDEDSLIPYQVGEVFVSCTVDETNALLEKAKENTTEDIAKLETDMEANKEILKDLKVHLYAKFGKNINLEADDDS